MRNHYDHAVIVPTCAIFENIERYFPRFIEYSTGNNLIILSINSEDEEEILKVKNFCSTLRDVFDKSYDGNYPDIDFVVNNSRVGFANAVNYGLRFLKEKYSITNFVTIANDDLIVTKDWLKYLKRACKAKYIYTESISMNEDMAISYKDIFPNSKIGMAGPISDGVYNSQKFGDKNLISQLGIDQYSKEVHKQNLSQYYCTKFLSGFCLTLKKDCLEDLWEDSYNGLFDPRFKVGGFEDNDLALRASKKGWISIIATDCFVGHNAHTTLDTIPGSNVGLNNVFEYYKKYKSVTKKDQKIVGSYRVAIKTVNDIVVFKSSFLRAAKLLDGISVLITNNPSECLKSPDRSLVSQLNTIDQKMLEDCFNLNQSHEENMVKVNEIINTWISTCLKYKQQEYENLEDDVKKSIGYMDFDVPINTGYWSKEFNERDERNFSHEIAEKLDPDWILSIDSDEIIEDRITYDLIHKWCSHPDPQKELGFISFLNHWESPELIREDPPFKTMAGPRLWRVNKQFPQRIVAGNNIGLHCGNSPEYGRYTHFCTGLRMRHMSHVREIDRKLKHQFYTELDKDKKEKLIGSSNYDHIIRKNVPVSIYNANNGIALFMLCYENEDVVAVERWLSNTFNFVDNQILVWTGDWEEEHKEWLNYDLDEILEMKTWYSTGPSKEYALMKCYYDVIILHSKLSENGLAECRNAAIQHVYKNLSASIGWCIFFDPDEQVQISSTVLGLKLINYSNDNNTEAYMLKFKNPLNTTDIEGSLIITYSECVRMFKINQNKPLYMSGKVHEGFQEALDYYSRNNNSIKLSMMNLDIVNYGLSLPPKKMAEKLKKYTKLLESQLKDNPQDSASLLSLGLQYLNDDKYDEAEECFLRSCKYSNGSHMPYKEMFNFYARKCKIFLQLANQRLPKGHPYNIFSSKVIEAIDSWNIDLPKVNTGGYCISEDVFLPPEFKEDLDGPESDSKGNS